MPEKMPSIAPLNYQFTQISAEDVPTPYDKYRISYRDEEIRKFEVLFLHRLLRKNFGDPSELEYDKTKLDSLLPGGCKYSLGIIDSKLTFQSDSQISISQSHIESALKHTELREWKYYVRTNHNDIILIQSERYHSEVSIYHVLPIGLREPGQQSKKESERFVDALLREADRQSTGGQLFNPKKEFESGDLNLYVLHNVYFENYLTADFLLKASLSGEQDIKEGLLEFDAADPEVRASAEKMRQIDGHIAVKGAYYLSSLLFFFMALEGFVNLIYHAFLKDTYRPESANIERLDLEQKLLFMPALCDGFTGDLINSEEYLKTFKQLKNLRNVMVHSKVSDSLIRAAFIEQAFVYNAQIKKQREDDFPPHKIYLDGSNVIKFKEGVDLLINRIKDVMDDGHRNLVDTHFMKKQAISFRNENGKIQLMKDQD